MDAELPQQGFGVYRLNAQTVSRLTADQGVGHHPDSFQAAMVNPSVLGYPSHGR